VNLKAVLFDLWGTLIVDPEQAQAPRRQWRAESVRAILAGHGIHLTHETADTALVAGGEALSALHDEGIDLTAAGRVGLFLKQLEGVPAPPRAALEELEHAITSMHLVYRPVVADGAVEALREVKDGGLATALVSNAGYTTAPHLREMLDGYGLAPYLDVFVFSDELELAKPDARLFTAALDALGFAAPQAAFVGDSPHNDIYGARQAGLYAVQIGHRDAPPRTGYTESDGARPHAYIDTLSELMEALRRLED
jgi:putative hydrolase of the HAD superfamily